MSRSAARKVTYSLPDDLLSEMESAVREGAAPSYSAFIAQAVREQLHRHHERRLNDALSAAAEDPLFLGDIKDTMRAFGESDLEIELGHDE